MVIAIIQARMNSTRLPGKVLMELEGKPFLWHVLERIKNAKKIDKIVLAIADNKESDVLEIFAKNNNIQYFRGSETNLVERYYLAAQKFGANVVVRIPSDNALTDPKIIDIVIEKHLNSDADYTSNILEETFPVGLHTEVFNFDALEKAYKNASDEYEKEHATPYIYRRPEMFKLQSVVAEGKLRRPDIRITTDTEEDLKLIREVYKNLYNPEKLISIDEVIDFLDKKNSTSSLPEFLLKKPEESFRNFLGASKETILRLQELYPREYFENEKSVSNEEREIVEKRKKMYMQEFAHIKKYFDVEKGGNVLDIGCGEGGFLSLFGANWKKYGVDISGYALEVAKKNGVIVDFEFEYKLFDLIIFRGTIQHIPDPISRIEKCYYWLKPGGGLAFLVTPNANSVYYKMFNTLPLLSDFRNFFVPSDIMLKRILKNFGYKVKGIEYPYLRTPYASPVKDLFNFILKFLRIKKNIKVPFYKNIMEVYAEKSQR